MVSEYPGEVSILALGPLTNLAKAVKRDSSFASKVKKVVILGGSFFALGNVNPAAEANVSSDQHTTTFPYNLLHTLRTRTFLTVKQFYCRCIKSFEIWKYMKL
ncbi:hypothetical protein CsSME_00038032 [Camellia sinensis var. sinensis]